ncbi:MAG: zinc ribbon domain-containing protein [Acidobacteriia bacterium]|nr:zinc ribbon domain-containing protein [Terriglobia bacterium]
MGYTTMRMSGRVTRPTAVGLFLAFILALEGPALAQGVIDMPALTQETQKLARTPGDITMVWWIPEDYWRASMAVNSQMTKAKLDEFIELLSPYTMVAVVDGKIGTFGSVTYKSEESIRESIVIKDNQGQSYIPLAEDAVSANMKTMLQIIKPMVANMLGNMGQNLHFVLFPTRTKEGTLIADAWKKGSFRVFLGTREFKWRLPLDSLLPGKKCASCGEEAKGSWIFCPWCGAKLPAAPAAKETERQSAPAVRK